jgi:hypothetical protein
MTCWCKQPLPEIGCAVCWSVICGLLVSGNSMLWLSQHLGPFCGSFPGESILVGHGSFSSHARLQWLHKSTTISRCSSAAGAGMVAPCGNACTLCLPMRIWHYIARLQFWCVCTQRWSWRVCNITVIPFWQRVAMGVVCNCQHASKSFCGHILCFVPQRALFAQRVAAGCWA